MFERILLCLCLLISFAGCGGGGNSSDGSSAKSVTLKIGLDGTLPANTAIAGTSFTLFLPTGVTPALTNGEVATGVVTTSGTFAGGTQIPPIYTPPAVNSAVKMQISLASMSLGGVIQVGEVATVILLSSNSQPLTTQNFLISTDGVVDVNGNKIAGINAVISNVTLN